MDFTDKSVKELIELRDSISALIKSKRAESKESDKEVRDARDAEMRTLVTEGASVTFLFDKEEVSGKVLRVSEKSVTVEFKNGDETVKRYRKYSDILSVA